MKMRFPALFITSLIVTFLFCSCIKAKSPAADNEFRFASSIMVDGRPRSFIVNLPPNYYESADFSLVIAMHGGGGNAEQFESSSKLTDKAKAAGFIVVCPEGVRSTGLLALRKWNAGTCCSYASENNIDDVKFISELIDNLSSQYKINRKKIYATGHSNGGMLSYRLACELSHKIAAFAPNAATMVVTQPCVPSRPVPILHMHSIHDQNVPYTGGVGIGPSNIYNPPLDSVMKVLQSRNKCNQPAQVIIDNAGYTLLKWTDCLSNVSVHYYLTKDGGHSWPGGSPGGPNGDQSSVAINANDLMWEFFQQYQLP